MPINLDLPDILRDDHDDATYTAHQLQPTIARLRAAVDDLGGETATPQALAAAWTRVAELRLPRKAVPGPVLTAIEDLVVEWGAQGMGGIARYAYSLNAGRDGARGGPHPRHALECRGGSRERAARTHFPDRVAAPTRP